MRMLVRNVMSAVTIGAVLAPLAVADFCYKTVTKTCCDIRPGPNVHPATGIAPGAPCRGVYDCADVVTSNPSATTVETGPWGGGGNNKWKFTMTTLDCTWDEYECRGGVCTLVYPKVNEMCAPEVQDPLGAPC
ncbi:MAG: hypothetical protein K2Q09_06680 [Phycisphaerales bacterium]|nr:hypothetical protein [Phycisphaerales bacterium]